MVLCVLGLVWAKKGLSDLNLPTRGGRGRGKSGRGGGEVMDSDTLGGWEAYHVGMLGEFHCCYYKLLLIL